MLENLNNLPNTKLQSKILEGTMVSMGDSDSRGLVLNLSSGVLGASHISAHLKMFTPWKPRQEMKPMITITHARILNFFFQYQGLN